MSIPAASGWTTSRLTSSAWIFRANSRRCFRFMRCDLLGALPAAALALSCVRSRVVFHAMLSLLFEIAARPGRRKLHNLPSGVEPWSFFKAHAATILTIANHWSHAYRRAESATEVTALAVEPRRYDSNRSQRVHARPVRYPLSFWVIQ